MNRQDLRGSRAVVECSNWGSGKKIVGGMRRFICAGGASRLNNATQQLQVRELLSNELLGKRALEWRAVRYRQSLIRADEADLLIWVIETVSCRAQVEPSSCLGRLPLGCVMVRFMDVIYVTKACISSRALAIRCIDL